jgi:bifunctional ADP-heptose synthase (sugar kinase/adenylyltransferase)
MSSNLQCPVDFITINEHKARVTAFFVLGLAVTYLLTNMWLIFAVLAIDFLLRAANLGKYSILGFLSDAVIRQLKIKNKPVDRAPKRFAAWIGFVFTLSILAALLFNQALIAQVLIAILIVFACLEAFAGFCAGCYVYTGLLLLKKRG